MNAAKSLPKAGGARVIRAPGVPDRARFGGWAGLAASVLIHGVMVLVGGWLWVRPITYGVTAGESSIEVDLIAAPAAAQPAADPAPVITAPEPVPQAEPEPRPETSAEPAADETLEPAARPEPPKPAPAPSAARSVGDGSSPVPGHDAVTLRSAAGAQTPARPNYLRNPAPRYPEASRKNSEEGLVLLTVEVSASGRPTEVTLARSSGYERLDRAAAEAVRRWTFEPARLGPLPVASTVQVPVRFRLSDPR